MLSDRKSQVALIGFGPGGRIYHAPFITVTDELDLALIVTSDTGRADQAHAEYPRARVVNSAEELFANPAGVDVAVITTPNRTHVPLALAALEAGLHVVVDKPLAPTSAEARQLADEAERRGLVLTVYHNRRFDGDFVTLRRLLREQKIGGILRFESRFERWRPEPKSGWRESADLADAGGILFDLGPHLIDQALVLFGPVTQVYAEIDRRRAGVAVDDDVFIALSHTSGVRSHLWMSALAANPGPRFRVLGTTAAYTKFGMDVQEAALLRGERPRDRNWGVEPSESWGSLGIGDDVARVPSEPGRYQEFYAGVARAVRGLGPPPVDPRDAITGLDIIEAARLSAAQRSIVKI